MGKCFSKENVEAAANVVQGIASALDQSQQPSDASQPPAPHPQPDGSIEPTSPKVKYIIQNAWVFKMPDGDTFTCEHMDNAGEKTTSRVRIMAIDCPESKQNFGQEAREIGEKMVFRTHVTLHVHDTDRYGRIVADVVTKDGQNYGCEMLRQGAAWHYKAYDRREEYAQLEQEARQAGIGLWSYPRPQEPWEYRRRIRENN